MARKIRTLEEIASDAPVTSDPAATQQGVVFINNYLNREFQLPDQSKFKFTHSRQTFTDPKQIAHLRKLIEENVNVRIFEEQPPEEVLPTAANEPDPLTPAPAIIEPVLPVDPPATE